MQSLYLLNNGEGAEVTYTFGCGANDGSYSYMLLVNQFPASGVVEFVDGQRLEGTCTGTVTRYRTKVHRAQSSIPGVPLVKGRTTVYLGGELGSFPDVYAADAPMMPKPAPDHLGHPTY